MEMISNVCMVTARRQRSRDSGSGGRTSETSLLISAGHGTAVTCPGWGVKVRLWVFLMPLREPKILSSMLKPQDVPLEPHCLQCWLFFQAWPSRSAFLCLG